MNEQPKQNYITSLILSLFQPVVKLIFALDNTPLTKPNEVQAGAIENGLSCGISTLSIFILEGALNRVRNVRGENQRSDGPEYLSQILPSTDLGQDANELYALRDAIVHNHLWEAEVIWTQDFKLVFGNEPKLKDGFGNKRLSKVIDSRTRSTQRLGLNLFPTRIWRRDAYTVFNKLLEILFALENLDRNYIYISHFPFRYGNQTITLKQISSRLVIPK